MTLLLLGLATWRLTNLILHEDGPFRMLDRVRQLVGTEKPGKVTGLRQLFTCPYCMSMWTAPVVFAVWRYWSPPVYVLAASAITVFIHEVYARET